MTLILISVLVLLAVAAAIAAVARPHLALLAIVFMFSMEQLCQSYIGAMQGHGQLFNWLVGGVVLIAVGKRVLWRDGVATDLNNVVTWLIFAQFGLWMVAMTYTPGEAPISTSFGNNYQYLILRLILLPLLVLNLQEMRSVFFAMMVAGAVMAVLILLNPTTSYYHGRLVMDVGMIGRREDAIGSPLATAEMGGMIALIAALITPPRRKGVYTLLRVAAFVLGLGLAIGSGSRGQVLATVVAGILFFPVARRLNSPRNFILSALGLMIIVGGLYGTFQLFIGQQNQERWDPVLMLKDITMRFDMCHTYLDAWLASPSRWLFGLGTHAWMGIGASKYQVDYVHNIFIEILCEQGLVGASILVVTTFLAFREGLRLWRLHSDDPSMRSVAAILLAICTFVLFTAFKQGGITSMLPFYWWLVLAKVSRHEHRIAAASVQPVDDVFPEYPTEHPRYALARG